ncbi:hypothetical protein A2V49_01440 [candidate division WWE3 bacterium RBG_19FT_COMBO_34_6]|uniref:Abasic site processing protein n=1 Tax=candidate division WWE3 bacterium RBG_19FT_COMBO_34_6 TaxID=1802612 RepID=A0A1F4UK05_UNCKA|nr:MAG: hypothetical protein A2V49_01440 [candidate division WWE3 bacterium RBG_19FT_COMBO_34_6]
MCGRYVLDAKPEKIYQKYHIDTSKQSEKINFEPMFNIFPSSLLPVITWKNEFNIEIMKWGMMLNLGKNSYQLINTRRESLIEKPIFLKIFLHQRCLIPATGFYEWKTEGKNKTPYKLWLKNIELFSFAGIYNILVDTENKLFKNFSIITTMPNDLVEKVHNRMPVIFDEEQEKIWLEENSTFEQLSKIINPFPSREMEMEQVVSFDNKNK